MNGKPITVILRVYRHEKTLEREFSSFYDAQGAIELMRKSNPDLIVEPYVQSSDGIELGTSELNKDRVTDLAYRAKPGKG